MFLVPLVAVISVIVVAYSASLYHREYEHLRLGTVRLNTTANGLYNDGLRHNTVVLRTIMDVLAHDETLRTAFARRDAAALLRHAAPIFSDLKRDYDITHFYFIRPDRVTLLRVHNPERRGDLIDRVTLLRAESEGTTAHGVELGPYGTLTLRLVTPWHDPRTRRLIGYVELGMETDGIMAYLHNFFHAEAYFVVRKEFLKRGMWEEGMRMLGHAADWDRFPGVVLSMRASQALPSVLAERFASDTVSEEPILDIRRDHTPYRAVFVPLRDIAGHNVGLIALISDVSQELEATRLRVYLGSAFVFVAGGLLAVFFFWHAGRIGRRIEQGEMELQHLATHDGLTNLFNRRMFHVLLEDELARARRFNRSVSLLMIDIDHFKRVNDAHGHQAGDVVLKGMGELLTRQARIIDRVCRYGGEEIAVILPETNVETANHIAERLRATVEREPFDIGGGKTLAVTVSIGAAAYPLQADTVDKLIKAADTALYAAKEGGRNRTRAFDHPGH